MSNLTEAQNQTIVDIEVERLNIYKAEVDSAIKFKEESLFNQELNKILQADNNLIINKDHLLMKVSVYNGIIQNVILLALLVVLIIK